VVVHVQVGLQRLARVSVSEYSSHMKGAAENDSSRGSVSGEGARQVWTTCHRLRFKCYSVIKPREPPSDFV
jgi:hypothetical protein